MVFIRDKRIGKNAKKIFDMAERGDAIVVIPTIVLAECFYIDSSKNTPEFIHKRETLDVCFSRRSKLSWEQFTT